MRDVLGLQEFQNCFDFDYDLDGEFGSANWMVGRFRHFAVDPVDAVCACFGIRAWMIEGALTRC